MQDVTLEALMKAFINSNFGWAVAGQFEKTFESRDFESMNYNALQYIAEAVEAVAGSGLLDSESEEELKEYEEELKEYLSVG